mmetsp:Transcript_49206/g.49972  ORF Transcript_49206/g.49972 Transcript_49206/m.49972 type:complete len:159 (-) Transcript_49206:498-974(-)
MLQHYPTIEIMKGVVGRVVGGVASAPHILLSLHETSTETTTAHITIETPPSTTSTATITGTETSVNDTVAPSTDGSQLNGTTAPSTEVSLNETAITDSTDTDTNTDTDYYYTEDQINHICQYGTFTSYGSLYMNERLKNIVTKTYNELMEKENTKQQK